MRKPATIVIACLWLAGCAGGGADQQLAQPTPSPTTPPPPAQQQAAAVEDYDCTVGIPGKLLSVTSHDEMVARFGKPTTEVARPTGGMISSYAKIDFKRVRGCRPMAPGSKAANRIQNIQFVFEADGTISTVNTNAPVPE
ncbi:MAG: hypothetical protein P4M07_09775 [Xanthobacteraceae bacterium]|nr:hypothetical protein [Xanthobacteraceae bacterium]